MKKIIIPYICLIYIRFYHKLRVGFTAEIDISRVNLFHITLTFNDKHEEIPHRVTNGEIQVNFEDWRMSTL